jgi:hypothetical protein
LLEDFLVANPAAVLLEDGRILFDMRSTHYSLSTEYGRCVLHLWSEEMNLIRTVLEVQPRKGLLRLATRRLGQTKPVFLEFVADRDRRTPTTRDAERRKYMRLLERVLTREFPDASAEAFRSAMDLEHSFGPAYARGIQLRGSSAWAVLGVNAEESSGTIDAALTLGILWLDYCRQHSSGRRLFEGLRLVLPAGTEATTASRMAWLNQQSAQWQLYTLDAATEQLVPIDFTDTGNTAGELTHTFDAPRTLERFAAATARLLDLIPPAARRRVELRPRSAAELAYLLEGLEFARVRIGFAGNTFTREETLTFGAGSQETLLDDDTTELFRELFERLAQSRTPNGLQQDPLFRLQSERWLEAHIRRNLASLDTSLVPDVVYSQVTTSAAGASGDRGLMDLLAIDRKGRLHILELKTEEDMQLPMQALDYWIRVRRLNSDHPAAAGISNKGIFERSGYFPGHEVSLQVPLLTMVAPALRIHPSNEAVLRYLSPEVEWRILAIAEGWRREIQVIFRKRSTDAKT